jgi:hypothetical protein
MAFTPGEQEYATPGSYTFNVPAGVDWVSLTGIAGGGGGGSTTKVTAHPSGGGGAGESCNDVQIKVTAGGTLSVVVGVGGTHGIINVDAINCGIHDPEGSVGSHTNGGQGGGDTIVGPITLKGGWGGLDTGNGGTGGMGGAVGAWRTSGNSGSGSTNAGGRVGGTGGRVATYLRPQGVMVGRALLIPAALPEREVQWAVVPVEALQASTATAEMVGQLMRMQWHRALRLMERVVAAAAVGIAAVVQCRPRLGPMGLEAMSFSTGLQ